MPTPTTDPTITDVSVVREADTHGTTTNYHYYVRLHLTTGTFARRAQPMTSRDAYATAKAIADSLGVAYLGLMAR